MSSQSSTPLPGSAESALDGRLDSWKEIAAYLRREVRTVQRWEKSAGLPVHRLQVGKQGPVYAFKAELDAWYSRPKLESDSADQYARPLFDIQRIRPWAVSAAAVLIALLSVGAYLPRKQLVLPKPFRLPQKSQYVVEGSVQRCGNQVRIDAQLIFVDDQMHVWRKSFTGDAFDILHLEDEAGIEVARQIELRARGLAPIRH